MSVIKEKVKLFVVDNFLMGKRADEINDNASFLAIGVLDSTGVIELVSFLEEAFQIKVEDEEMIPENLDSLMSIERYVISKTA